jgi:hypothetical protein
MIILYTQLIDDFMKKYLSVFLSIMISIFVLDCFIWFADWISYNPFDPAGIISLYVKLANDGQWTTRSNIVGHVGIYFVFALAHFFFFLISYGLLFD